MKTLTCMIVDDEPLAVKMLEDFVSRTPYLRLAASFNDPVLALSTLCESPVDVLFLDIQMPDLDGLNLSRMVPPSTRVIFTTAFKEYAFDSYEVNALDFLLKPIRYHKFLGAVEKARQWFEMNSVKEERGSLFVRVDSQLRRAGAGGEKGTPAEREVHPVAGGHRHGGRPAGGRITKSLEKERKKYDEVCMHRLRLGVRRERRLPGGRHRPRYALERGAGGF